MSGNGWLSFGTQGSSVDQFRYPSQLFFSPDGKLYISDSYNSRIVRIDDITGAGWEVYGSVGTGTNQFAAISPGHIWVD